MPLVLLLSEVVLVLVIAGGRDARHQTPDVIVDSYAANQQLLAATDSMTSIAASRLAEREQIFSCVCSSYRERYAATMERHKSVYEAVGRIDYQTFDDPGLNYLGSEQLTNNDLTMPRLTRLVHDSVPVHCVIALRDCGLPPRHPLPTQGDPGQPIAFELTFAIATPPLPVRPHPRNLATDVPVPHRTAP